MAKLNMAAPQSTQYTFVKLNMAAPQSNRYTTDIILGLGGSIPSILGGNLINYS
jgi:hypothetical protein